MKKKSETDSPLNDVRIGQITKAWADDRGLLADYSNETGSTNDMAKSEASELEEPLKIYLTEAQTKGRGRKTNSWSTARAGSQLLSTWSFKIETRLSPLVSPLVGLALYRAALATWPFLEWSLKAPNDLYLDEKKVAGLLIEVVSQGTAQRLIIGLGLNVFESPADISTATSIAEEMPKAIPLLGEDWIAFLDRWLFELSQSLGREDFSISLSEQKSLLKALNDFPHLEDEYIAISEKGDLATKDKKISWMDL